MPADKLILLSPWIRKSVKHRVEENGVPIGRYRKSLDLSKTQLRLPVRISCGGSLNETNKIEFFGIAYLGLTRTEEIVRFVCEQLSDHIKIYRIDWAVDIPDVSTSQVAACCRFSGTQSSAFFQSRLGTTYYPHKSKERTVMIYDRLSVLRSRHHPSAECYEKHEQLTRLEVQFRGAGVPIKRFDQLREYEGIDLLRGMKLVKVRQPATDATPKDILVFEGLKALIAKMGLQSAAKRFSSSQWAYFQERYFLPVAPNGLPDVRARLAKSTRDWLADIIRFPRTKR